MCKNIDGNREYKDNVFRLLFGNKSKSAELYNAIKGTNYTADEISINTLQNPLFAGLRNDISFSVENKFIVLIEHQSSVNPNMGLRFLLYISRIYDQFMDKDGIYRTKPISIENPEFYVMYNGKDDYPEKSTIKLSDLYKVKDDKGNAANNLDLTVTVYNVNIMKRSRTLDEYTVFIAKVRDYIKNSALDLTEALQKAVMDCVRENILREFLEKNGGDIMSILSREFNIDDALRVRSEEAEEEGFEKRAEKTAKRMLLNSEPLNKIIDYTELSEEKILDLKKHLKA